MSVCSTEKDLDFSRFLNDLGTVSHPKYITRVDTMETPITISCDLVMNNGLKRPRNQGYSSSSSSKESLGRDVT